jgi:hypothetical protein
MKSEAEYRLVGLTVGEVEGDIGDFVGDVDGLNDGVLVVGTV